MSIWLKNMYNPSAFICKFKTQIFKISLRRGIIIGREIKDTTVKALTEIGDSK